MSRTLPWNSRLPRSTVTVDPAENVVLVPSKTPSSRERSSVVSRCESSPSCTLGVVSVQVPPFVWLAFGAYFSVTTVSGMLPEPAESLSQQVPPVSKTSDLTWVKPPLFWFSDPYTVMSQFAAAVLCA